MALQKDLFAVFGNKIKWWDKASYQWKQGMVMTQDTGKDFILIVSLNKPKATLFSGKHPTSGFVGFQVLVVLPGKWCKYYSAIPTKGFYWHSQEVTFLVLPLTLSSCKFTFKALWTEQPTDKKKDQKMTTCHISFKTFSHSKFLNAALKERRHKQNNNHIYK